MAQQAPITGRYFANDIHEGTDRKPMDIAGLAKFDNVPGVSRIYDSGFGRFYDLRWIQDRIMRNELRAKLLKIDCVAFAALACYAVSVTLFVPDLLAHMAGTILCFVLTGVALASAVAPRPMSPAARFTTIVACVLGTGIVGGLIVNYLPAGIVRFNWVTYALLVTLISWAVARARGASGPVRWEPPKLAMPTIGAAVKVTGWILHSHCGSGHFARQHQFRRENLHRVVAGPGCAGTIGRRGDACRTRH